MAYGTPGLARPCGLPHVLSRPYPGFCLNRTQAPTVLGGGPGNSCLIASKQNVVDPEKIETGLK